TIMISTRVGRYFFVGGAWVLEFQAHASQDIAGRLHVVRVPGNRLRIDTFPSKRKIRPCLVLAHLRRWLWGLVQKGPFLGNRTDPSGPCLSGKFQRLRSAPGRRRSARG